MAKKKKPPPDPTPKLAVILIALLVLGAMGTSIINEQERQGVPPIIPRIDRPLTKNQYAQSPGRVQVPPCKMAQTGPEREYGFWDYFKDWEQPLRVGTKNITPFGCEVAASRPYRVIPGGRASYPGY